MNSRGLPANGTDVECGGAARTVSESAIDSEANTKSNCRFPVDGSSRWVR